MPEGVAAEEPGDEWCSQRGLLDPATCSDVAKHCNETKQAAKVVQVGFLPLSHTLLEFHVFGGTLPQVCITGACFSPGGPCLQEQSDQSRCAQFVVCA